MQVAAIGMLSRCVYSTQFGCPPGGEPVMIFQGNCNPKFDDLEKYKSCAKLVLFEVAWKMKQATTQITFFDSELLYVQNATV